MSIINALTSWNVRGLMNKTKKVQDELRRLKSVVYILCETRVREPNLKKVMSNGWFNWEWASNHQAHPGGRLIVL